MTFAFWGLFMCGRYTISHSTEEILERFQINDDNVSIEPSYNVAPSQLVPVIMAESAHSPKEPSIRLLELCKWGLVPFWVKDLKGAKPLINARAESLAAKAAFKQAFIKRRCVIPADGFYEWRKDKNRKVPMRIHLADEKLFGFAGIYQDWKAPDGVRMRTFAIITVPAKESIRNIHDRMPAILTPEFEKIWLDPEVEDEEALAACLRPYPYEDLEAYAVSTLVNKPDANSPELIQPSVESTEEIAAPPLGKRKRRGDADAPQQLRLPLS
jgi:putative SOS response-associated peptidase YedK